MPEKVTFFGLLFYERVSISLVEIGERGGKSDTAVCKKLKRAINGHILWLTSLADQKCRLVSHP